MSDHNSSSGPYCVCRSYDDSRFMICCDKCNQWFHGDCVRVKSDEAKKIAHFYCPPCQKTNPSLKTIYRSGLASPHNSHGLLTSSSSHCTTETTDNVPVSTGSDTVSKLDEPAAKRSRVSSVDAPNCGNCIGCFRKENCGRCEVCKAGKADLDLCLLRRCVNSANAVMTKETARTDSDEEVSETDRRKRLPTSSRSNAKVKNVSNRNDGSTRRKVGRPPKHKTANTNNSPSQQLSSGGTRSSARAYRKFLKDAGVIAGSDDETDKGKDRQCYGPGCIYAARPQSKYCSDECGMKLAQLRIHALLPSRLEQWYARRPVAEEYEQRRLERIRITHELGRSRLTELDYEEKELNTWKEKCKAVRIKENESKKGAKKQKDATGWDDPEISVYCFTCGNETTMKNAIKHFSKCFAKYESQTSYGSSFKAVNNLYNIFCDTYNKTNRTYCKRLRVICPEHSKDGKVEPHEICGCPLNPNKPTRADEFDTALVCTQLKKNCLKHYRWLQIRRALIDMERLSQLLRLEELSEETRCIQMAQTNRGNLLALLLHQTISHDQDTKKENENGEVFGTVENGGQQQVSVVKMEENGIEEK